MIGNRVLSILFTSYIITFFVAGCAKNDVAIEPISTNEAMRNSALRDKYETLLFNHLRFRGQLPMKSRFESIQKMAKDGFKPAELALALYDIKHSDLKTEDRNAENALDAMAESGNVTAQCLYAFYWRPDHAPERWRQYVLSSSSADVAYCMALRATYLEKDGSKEQLDWRYKSALKGDAGGQIGMAYAYYEGNAVPKDIRSAICWAIEVKNTGSKSGGASVEAIFSSMMYFYMQETHDFEVSPPNAQFCKSVIQQRQ